MSDDPSKSTLAYWSRQITGCGLALNGFRAELAEHNEQIDALRARIADLERRHAADLAVIGELTARVDVLTERMDKASAVVAGLKKNGAAA